MASQKLIGQRTKPVGQFDRRPLIRPSELAEYLGIPEHTLAQWRYLRLGPAFHRVGRHVRYAWVDIERWLIEQRSQGT
jgi:hypothetical protein